MLLGCSVAVIQRFIVSHAEDFVYVEKTRTTSFRNFGSDTHVIIKTVLLYTSLFTKDGRKLNTHKQT